VPSDDHHQANHYVACTGDYDCAADEHIEGCGIVDKRAPLEQRQADDHFRSSYNGAFDRSFHDYCRDSRPDYARCEHGDIALTYIGGRFLRVSRWDGRDWLAAGHISLDS
jgi:hypothetical protein